MTALSDGIATQIATTGPISIAEFMALCLLHPTHGYYTTRLPLGRSGDFITAPEISQMFGELVGLCLVQAWLDQGAPSPVAVVELGPGRGTLMADLRRATARVPGFAAAAEVHLVEASPTLRAEQAGRVPDATWHDTVETLPHMPTLLVANEFFDALPVRQFIRDGAGWRERQVGLVDGVLAFGLSAPMPPETLPDRTRDTKDGDLVEVRPAAEPYAAAIGRRVADHGGAALIIDYGSWRSLGDTFQAIAAHKRVNPLANPGAADITAHVAFEEIARGAAPARSSGLTPQGAFLGRLGIAQRTDAIAKGLTGDALNNHLDAARRLTDPDQMGNLFQVLGLTPPGAPPLAGLDG